MRGLVAARPVWAFALAWAFGSIAEAQEDFIPRAQDRPPGPALSPGEAIAKMTVPPGFRVEVVASEPDLVNPVAMTFDEKGRVWVTESLEYPRKSAGPGRDRVKVLEDTDGDGKADRFTVFAEGLNIPSGIAVGHGGVWVANSPDLLFMQDTDGDGKADKTEVIVSGFGRDDTHELPNSLTWGPDGWLYGWNGVFNGSHVEYRGKTYDFTCAIFRIHPRTREFQVWCEGTSNPWGIAFNADGDAFASACVIDHFWHLTESGYYHRQGGPYPPFTWKLESIVDFGHQKAAYCGVHFFDSDAYPSQYRGKYYMGNIHGNCINVDSVEKKGATYRAFKQEDFLTAHDAWFMPVVQKTGPDGSLYVLDWYDRYHCYQDANRDPAGVDRLKGRLYRVRYGDTPRRSNFDLSKKSDEELIGLLGAGNGYDREIAQRLLAERGKAVRPKLMAAIVDPKTPRRQKVHATWALIGAGPIDLEDHKTLLADADPTVRGFAVRAAGDQVVDPAIRSRALALAKDPEPSVRLQVAIAARKFDGIEPIPVLMEVLSRADDVVTPPVVWQNLHPMLESGAYAFIEASEKFADSKNIAQIYPRTIERLMARRSPDAKPVALLLARLLEGPQADASLAGQAIAGIAAKVQNGEVAGARAEALRSAIGPVLARRIALDPGLKGPGAIEAALLSASWKEQGGIVAARSLFSTNSVGEAVRLQALAALVAAGDANTVEPRRLGPGRAEGRIALVPREVAGEPQPSRRPEGRLGGPRRLSQDGRRDEAQGRRAAHPEAGVDTGPDRGRAEEGSPHRRRERDADSHPSIHEGCKPETTRPRDVRHRPRGAQPGSRAGRREDEAARPLGARGPVRGEEGLRQGLRPVPQDLRGGAGGGAGPHVQWSE